MKYVIIGLSKVKEYEEGGQAITVYEIYMKKLGVKYKMTVEYKKGECYSGYTSAERLDMDLEKVDNFGPIQYYPKGILEIEENEIYDPESWSEYIHIYVNDDYYYPSAKFDIKYDMWQKTPRYQRLGNPIYIFYGDNGTGKSTIALKAFKKILETDSLKKPSDLNKINIDDYECIVVGGKHKDIIYDIGALDYSGRNVIKVKFSSDDDLFNL